MPSPSFLGGQFESGVNSDLNVLVILCGDIWPWTFLWEICSCCSVSFPSSKTIPDFLYLVLWGSPWKIWGSKCINHLFPSEWSWGVGYLFLIMLSQEQCLWWEMSWTSTTELGEFWFYILWDAGNCWLVSDFSQREIVYKLLLYWCVWGEGRLYLPPGWLHSSGEDDSFNFSQFCSLWNFNGKGSFLGDTDIQILIINDLNYFNFIDIFFISFR